MSYCKSLEQPWFYDKIVITIIIHGIWVSLVSITLMALRIVKFDGYNMPHLITIDWQTHAFLAVCTIMNNIIGPLASNTVDPWIINTLQKDGEPIIQGWSKPKVIFMVSFYRMMGWFDYMLFLIIAINRMDMLIIGIGVNTITISCVNYWHLKLKKEDIINYQPPNYIA